MKMLRRYYLYCRLECTWDLQVTCFWEDFKSIDRGMLYSAITC